MPCSEYGMNVTNCNTTELSWFIIPGGENQPSCIPRRYTGSLCLSLLQSWQGCAVGDTQDVLVDVSGDIEELDRAILMTSNAFGTLSYLSSTPLNYVIDQPLCQEAVLSLLCQFTFPLCSCYDGDLYLPSQEECLRISTDVCATEWSHALNNGLILPNCSSFFPVYGK